MVKLSVLSAAEIFAEPLVLYVASSTEGEGVNTFEEGSGAGTWAGGDACGVWGVVRTITLVTAWADAALSPRLHALTDRLSAAASTAPRRIPLVRMGSG